MEKVWHDELEGDAILRKSKKFIPSVEAPFDKLLDHIKNQMDAGKFVESAFQHSMATSKGISKVEER